MRRGVAKAYFAITISLILIVLLILSMYIDRGSHTTYATTNTWQLPPRVLEYPQYPLNQPFDTFRSYPGTSYSYIRPHQNINVVLPPPRPTKTFPQYRSNDTPMFRAAPVSTWKAVNARNKPFAHHRSHETPSFRVALQSMPRMAPAPSMPFTPAAFSLPGIQPVPHTHSLSKLVSKSVRMIYDKP